MADVSTDTVMMRTYFIEYSAADWDEGCVRLISIIGVDIDKSLLMVWQHASASDTLPEGNPIATGIRTLKMGDVKFLDYGEPEPVPVSVLAPQP